MNGRVYDPVLGRFLSADPFIGDVGDSQEYNRYSYVTNNPLKFTDPSGYRKFWDVVKQSFFLGPHILTDPMYWASPKTFNQYYGQAARVAVTAVVSYFAGPVVGGMAGGAYSAFAGSLLNGGSIGDAFKAGAIGAGIGAVSGYVGSIGNIYVRVAANAVLGGAIAEAQGGEFRHGFYAGLASGLFAPTTSAIGNRNWYAGLVMSAIVGGTASELGGGKFANGAVTAAFQYVLANVPTKERLSGSRNGGRLLTANEIAAAKGVFGDKIDYSQVRIYNSKVAIWQGSGYAVTPDGSIYFPEAPADFILAAETANYDSAGLFIHEMTHVMQYQQGVNVLGRGLLLQGAKFGSFGLYDPYKFTYTPGAGLSSYNIEQQGELARGAYHGLFPNLFK